MIPLLRYLLGAGLILALHAGAEEPLRRYLYAATPDGAQFETGSGEGLLVFDIDHGFKLVRRIGGLSLQTGTRGLTGCTATHSLYYSTTGQGMGRLDLETDKVIFTRSGNARAADPRELARKFADHGKMCQVAPDAAGALEAAERG